MVDHGIYTKQGDFGSEALQKELLDKDEYDPLFGSNLSSRLYEHDNSAFDMWQKNSDGKKVKKVKATCNVCDEMHKSSVPSINAANFKKRSKHLEKLEECIYILDNSWRRREQQQIESIEFRGDIPYVDPETFKINTQSGTMTKMEKNHLDTAYIYRDRMRKCIEVRDKLKENIDIYKDKLAAKQNKKTAKKKKTKSNSGSKSGKTSRSGSKSGKTSRSGSKSGRVGVTTRSRGIVKKK